MHGGTERKLFGISSQTFTFCGPALFGLKIVDFQKARNHFFLLKPVSCCTFFQPIQALLECSHLNFSRYEWKVDKSFPHRSWTIPAHLWKSKIQGINIQQLPILWNNIIKLFQESCNWGHSFFWMWISPNAELAFPLPYHLLTSVLHCQQKCYSTAGSLRNNCSKLLTKSNSLSPIGDLYIMCLVCALIKKRSRNN